MMRKLPESDAVWSDVDTFQHPKATTTIIIKATKLFVFNNVWLTPYPSLDLTPNLPFCQRLHRSKAKNLC
jgi:hypothetical protein